MTGTGRAIANTPDKAHMAPTIFPKLAGLGLSVYLNSGSRKGGEGGGGEGKEK